MVTTTTAQPDAADCESPTMMTLSVSEVGIPVGKMTMFPHDIFIGADGGGLDIAATAALAASDDDDTPAADDDAAGAPVDDGGLDDGGASADAGGVDDDARVVA